MQQPIGRMADYHRKHDQSMCIQESKSWYEGGFMMGGR